ncbi:3-isopropylmalate dehydrogenase [Aureibacillus halotolerans]|uniref:3-isopropylmalate dehydrogenase n=1 Tax=Aureibacillus halotolerans TaxID=1508390 RepID=A0A4R6TYK3_9BACI|nr:3-isopropylmalate dehydrogenase [Aureibacillus halotolerans]TDQ37932.1 3-isopropylmalate dehydrogenase [Aureibacillus halotolerans]
MTKKIAVLPGDGIGQEITEGTVDILHTFSSLFDRSMTFEYGLIGGHAIDETGDPLPEATVTLCQSSDAVLLGAVGGPKWDRNPSHLRPEKGLLGIRKALGLFANLRPVKAIPALLSSSTLKEEVVRDVDLLIVRELTGGLYFGEPSERRQVAGEDAVVDTLFYTRSEIERILRKGFELAQIRKKRVVSVDKANVLESSKLWREIAEEIAGDYPDVTLEHMLVDNAAMQLIRTPAQFDVVVTENLFGDILSDEASMLTGSLGMLPSASLSETGPGLFEPVHGSAPDIAGRNEANPMAMILSAAMMVRVSFGWEKEATLLEEAVFQTLKAGVCTKDIAAATNRAPVGTSDVIAEIKRQLQELAETKS